MDLSFDFVKPRAIPRSSLRRFGSDSPGGEMTCIEDQL